MLNQIIVSSSHVSNAVAEFRRTMPDTARRAGLARIAKAQDIAESNMVHEVAPGLFVVKSQSNNLGHYDVDERDGHHTCTCPDFPRVMVCKHRLACLFAITAWTEQAQDAIAIARQREDDAAQVRASVSLDALERAEMRAETKIYNSADRRDALQELARVAAWQAPGVA